MSTSLSVVIKELNQTKNSRAPIDDTPLQSIVNILNSHLTALEWIERSNAELEMKLENLKNTQNEASKSTSRIHGGINR
jgi:hypothetical protein